jgi:hypothetical protein
MSKGFDKNLGLAVGRAADLYRLWHQKEAEEDIEVLDLPLEAIEVFHAGRADSILYVSDKWEDDGNVYDYSHEFDSGPSVYMEDGEGDQGDVEELLQTAVSARAKAPFPVLAGVKELILVDDDGNKRVLRFKVTPMLLMTLDKRGLLILSKELGPIYIRGGKMHVTERGIHR